jgi:hypothetical protein
VVIDREPRATVNAFGIRETAVIIDLRTMKIVRKINGATDGTGTTSVAQLVPEILELLRR